MRLDVFSQKKLHEALTEKGYDVSLRTVRRWIEGEANPNGAWSRAILEVLDIQKEAAEPEWVQRLEGRLIELRANQDRVAQSAAQGVVSALSTPELLAWQERIADVLAALPMPSDGAPDGPPGTAAPGGAEPVDRELV